MTREDWLTKCAAAIESAGHHFRVARAWALDEFNECCREEPESGSPVLPSGQWPDPAGRARELLEEMAAQSAREG